tara:strand:+ start:681 stop:956 length:276 start_codon:yes stop_codon:yes gene_type:complete
MYMKNKFLIISLAMSGFAFGQSVDSTCVAITSKGLNCKIKVNIDTTNLCHHHKNKTVNYVKSVVCNALTTKNTNCKLKTKHTSKKCHHHRD